MDVWRQRNTEVWRYGGMEVWKRRWIASPMARNDTENDDNSFFIFFILHSKNPFEISCLNLYKIYIKTYKI